MSSKPWRIFPVVALARAHTRSIHQFNLCSLARTIHATQTHTLQLTLRVKYSIYYYDFEHDSFSLNIFSVCACVAELS